MECLECQELIKLQNQPYYPFWCKMFKIYLLPDAKFNPIRIKNCKLLMEDEQ